MAYGKCLLTGKQGTYVRAHIIPQAFTRTPISGAPLLQVGDGTRPSRRWSSWYDSTIVTRAGEDLLARIDSTAVMELRRHKLVWSGWAHNQLSHEVSDLDVPPTLRELGGVDGDALRRFVLSLIWRAGVSRLAEMRPIQPAAVDLEKIAAMIRGEISIAQLDDMYPAYLSQLASIGRFHNQSPVADEMPNPNGGDPIPLYRFYFDGLVINAIRSPMNDAARKLNEAGFYVGKDKMMVWVHATENSKQYMNFESAIVGYE